MNKWRWGGVLAVVVGAVLWYRVQPASGFCFFLTDHCEVAGVQLPTLADTGQAIMAGFFGILNGIVNSLTGLALHIVDLLPDMPDLNLPDMSGIVTGYSQFNAVMPLSEGIQAAVVLLAARNASFLFRVGVTLWHLIPKPLSGT